MQKKILLIKALATIGLLIWLFVSHDLGELWSEVVQADKLLIIIGIVQLGLQPVFGALRWKVILNATGGNLPLGVAMRLTYISVFFNQVLPASVGGDVMRIWMVQKSGFSFKSAVSSVGLDRLFMLLTLIIVISLSAPVLSEKFGISIAANTFLVLTITLFGLAFFLMSGKIFHRLQHLRLFRGIVYLAQDAKRTILHFKTYFLITGLCLLSYFNLIASFYFFSLALSQQGSFYEYAILLPPVFFISALPISLGGWGPRELAAITFLATIGVSSGTALLLSLLLGIASILISLPGAYYFLKVPSWQVPHNPA